MFDYLYRAEMEDNLEDKFEEQEKNLKERARKAQEERIKKDKDNFHKYCLKEIDRRKDLEEAARKLA